MKTETKKSNQINKQKKTTGKQENPRFGEKKKKKRIKVLFKASVLKRDCNQKSATYSAN